LPIFRADEDVAPDLGAVLRKPIVIAGDGAGADIGALADRRIAEIGEVVRLDAGRERRVLHLDEIADMDAFAQGRTGPEPRERPDDRVIADFGAREMAEGRDLDPLAHRDLGSEDDERPDDAVAADL